jgi:hypothetical protein
LACQWDGGPIWEAWLATQPNEAFLDALTFINDVCDDAEAAPRLPGGEYVAPIEGTDGICYYTVSTDPDGNDCIVHVIDVADVPRTGGLWSP